MYDKIFTHILLITQTGIQKQKSTEYMAQTYDLGIVLKKDGVHIMQWNMHV